MYLYTRSIKDPCEKPNKYTGCIIYQQTVKIMKIVLDPFVKMSKMRNQFQGVTQRTVLNSLLSVIAE